MLIEFTDEGCHPNENKFTYDPENDILIMGDGDEQILLLDNKYFELDKNNVVKLRHGIDDLVDNYPEFFIECLKHRLLKFGIEIQSIVLASLQRAPVFTVESNEDHAYFLFLYHDNIIAKSEEDDYIH